MEKPYGIEPILLTGEFWPYRGREYLAGYYISYRGKKLYSFRGYEKPLVEKVCQYLNEAYENGKKCSEPETPVERIRKLENEIRELSILRDRLVREATLPK